MKKYFIAASADVYGNVQLAKDSNIWFQSVLRGDSNTITIGEGSNIQDGTIIHVDEDAPTIVGKYVTVGHQCMLHGCKIGDGALIGMGSTILNNAIIGEKPDWCGLFSDRRQNYPAKCFSIWSTLRLSVR